MSDENKRLSILDELDNFNTAPEADSFMLGILQEQEGVKSAPLAQESEPQPAPEPQPVPQPSAVPNDYLPLNTSIQELNSRFETRLGGLERAIQSLTSGISQQRQQVQQPSPQENYDLDAPMTGHHMQALAHRQDIAHQMAVRSWKQNLVTRAHVEYERFKKANPDFNFDPGQIDFAIEQMSRNGQLEQLEGTNWSGHFEQLYAPQRAVKLNDQSKRIEELQKEIESLKKVAAKASVPAQPVSPSTGRSSRGPAAISTPLTQNNEDAIVGLSSFRKKGDFKRFGNDLRTMSKRQGI